MISQGRHTGYPTEKSKIYTGFGLKHAARKCWDCEKKGYGGRVRKDQFSNACGSSGSKECKGKNSRHPSYPCEFLLRAQKAKKNLHIPIFHYQKYDGKVV